MKTFTIRPNPRPGSGLAFTDAEIRLPSPVRYLALISSPSTDSALYLHFSPLSKVATASPLPNTGTEHWIPMAGSPRNFPTICFREPTQHFFMSGDGGASGLPPDFCLLCTDDLTMDAELSSTGGGVVPVPLEVIGPLTNAQFLAAEPFPVTLEGLNGAGPIDGDIGGSTPQTQRVTLATDQPDINVNVVSDPGAFLDGINNIGPIDAGIGNASAQTLRTVLASDQPILPVTGPLTAAQLARDPYGRLQSISDSILGDLITAQRLNQLEVNFSHATFDAAAVINTVAGGGSATQANGEGIYATGAGASAEASGVSSQSILYRPGADVYAYFTAAFTTPTSAASFQRIGPFIATDGFFIGYEGVTFKATVRKNSIDTGTAQTAFNSDKLDGLAGSRYMRNGAPEAIDFTKLNIFRIRWSWFGSGPIQFEVLSPDGVWVIFQRIGQPNLSQVPSIIVSDLNMTVDVKKTASDATNLQIFTACWAAGTSVPEIKIIDPILDNTLAIVGRSVIVGHTTAGGGSYVNVKVNPSGALTTTATAADGDFYVRERGAATSTEGQVTIDTTATGIQIVAANATRRAVMIINHGTIDVFLKNGSVTTTTGALLPGVKGAAMTIPSTEAWKGITAAGSQVVSFVEIFD